MDYQMRFVVGDEGSSETGKYRDGREERRRSASVFSAKVAYVVRRPSGVNENLASGASGIRTLNQGIMSPLL